MEEKDIHIGDMLKIRSWEDMKSEYGVDEFGVIVSDKGVCFHEEMQHLCGRIFTVQDVEQHVGKETRYYSVEDVARLADCGGWYITAWMLEPYEDDEDFECATDDDFVILFS